MENKVVCYYCGTIYDSQEEKCPLCGGKAVAKEEEVYRPVQRQRITDQERRQRRRQASKGGKFAASNKNEKSEKPAKNVDVTKTMLIAALVFLSLAVVVVTWFIGDMIGWWGGVEDTVGRGSEGAAKASEGAALIGSEECTMLEVSTDKISLTEIGQSVELKLKVNESCRKYIEITFPNAAVVTAVSGGASELVDDCKVDTWVITAVSEGTTQMSFAYGEMRAVCDIVVGTQTAESTPDNDPEPTEPDEDNEPVEPDEDFEPRLNFESDLSFYQRGETVPLRVMNLPSGAKVNWKSSDITVAKIDENGLLTAVGYGKAKITAEVSGRKIELLVRCAFSDKADGTQDVTFGAHLSHDDVTIGVGSTFNLYLIDEDGERISDAVYSVSEEGICEINDGTVKGLVGGDYIVVTVTYNETEYKCTVRVRW